MSDGLRYGLSSSISVVDANNMFMFRLRQSWYNALSEAEAHFRQLLSSNSSRDWKRVSTSAETPAAVKGKARALTTPEVTDVIVHRKAGKSGDSIYRAVLDIPTGDEQVSLE